MRRSEPATLVNLLRARAQEHPERPAYTFLLDGEVETARLTYGDLDRQARAIAALLQERGAAGERALLLFPPGLEFVAAFFGCLYAGVVAVPAYPPRPGQEQPRLRSILADARPRFALTTAALAARLKTLAEDDPAFAALGRLAVEPFLDHGVEERAEDWREPALSGDALAFLQYTSGSTADPKGVEVRHGNLVFMERLIANTFQQDESAVVVGWLPVYHDMGLIGNVLQPLWLGASCVLMSPVSFLRRPRRWLEAIARYAGTTSGGPNFAYDLCVDRIGEEERQGLDLSSWQVAFNGAEPVRAATLERFARAFRPNGFRCEAFQPCYGLAEATLLVSGTRAGAGPKVLQVDAAALEAGKVIAAAGPDPRSRDLVGSGGIPEGQRIAVVDPSTLRRIAPGEVGEVWVAAGPGIPRGYWGRPEATRETFEARLDGEEGSFLRTGDLGFVGDGELFVTGRIKDLIILRGRNLYPQDIERTAEASAPRRLAAGAGAAFPIEVDGEERLVVAQELQPRVQPDEAGIQEIAAAIRRAVAEEHEAQVYDVVLLRPGEVPKTSSGKVQRRACRLLYLDGALEVAGRSRLAADGTTTAGERLDREALLALTPAGRQAALEIWLRRRAAEVLRIPAEELAPDRPLIELGLDSLAAIELGQALEAELGVALSPTAVLDGASIAELAAVALTPGPSPNRPPAPPGEGSEESLGKRAAFSPLSRGLGGRLGEGGQGGEGLSHGQRGLWFLDRLSPGGTAYHLVAAARLRGDVSPSALRAAFQTLVERHEALRTTYLERDGEPVRQVHAEAVFDFLESGRLEEVAWRPFDLANGPVLRVAVFGDAVLFAVHHIAADFWSLGLLARQLGELLSGREIGPAPSYSDFVAWQEAMLAGEEGERLERYWSERLQGLPALNLPVDRPRPASSGERGACRWRDLDPGLAEALKEVARSRGATLYAVLLTAFQTLLSRLSGQEDLAVGSPVAARPQGLPGAAETVGYFVNPVVLRADLSGEPSFLELLDRTRRVVLGALDHQGYPLPLLAERLRISSGKDALFRAMLVLHRPPFGLEELAGFALGEGGARLRLGGLDLESLPLAPRAAQFDLTLSAAERRGGLSLALVYDAGLFDEATADRWLGSLETLLRGIAARPQTPALDLPLLSSEERQQILAEAGADVEAPWRTLHEGFARQVEETPDRIALVWGGQRLSYAELGRRAGELAGRLRGLGAGPERIVGVRLPRTPELIVALLGVLESGAAYLPLDPAYPEERVRMMIEDAGAMATVMPRSMRIHTRARLSPGSGGGRKLAYLIYTSGSTGRPKAVAVEHASAVRLVAWARTVYQEDELAGVLASTSISFDLSVFEVFVPLLQGGTVILADDALALPGLPAAVTLVNTVPSAMAALLDMGPLPASVKTVNLAGEPLRQALAERVYAAGVERLWNLYGPSEDTTYSTGEVVRKGCEPGIGRAVAGSRAYVLDRGLRLQPVGIPGELCLGGGGLARGYLRRPALTAEKWVPDPFSEEPGARLYRTGDLARWRDGGLEYLGRLDRQVKVRGFRIEPGEIEATLLTHPAVRDAAVLAHKGSLAAFVVPADPGLREWLREKLPAQLVPDRFVALERLPLTPNGKVDRAALVLLAAARPSGGTEPPRGPAEERLAAIWAEVLGVETVGREDRFFDLGGHSLLATRVVSRISRSFGVELPLSTFFEEPTLAGLARRIEAARAISTAPIPRLPRTGDLPVSFAQERLWFLDQLEPGSPAYNMAGALRLHGDLDVARLGAALREIVRRHEVLRTTFQSREGRPYAVLSPVSESPLTLIDLSLIATPPSLEVEEALRPFDLARGPLFRATLVRLDPQDHLLLVTLHHTVADGWSVGLLARELATLYEGVPLAELPVQYADFAAWQRQQLSGDALAAQLRYWTGHLAGLDPAFDLPADRPRPPIASGRAGVERLLLSSGADLERLARQHGATLFMALLAGFETLLLRLTGRDDLAVGTPIANRTRVETEPLIGLFANTLVLRGDLAGDPSFAALLARVRETTLGAYAHQDLPFEKLVEALAPERALAHTPLFQVVFALQNTPRPEWRLPGLDTGPLEVGGGIAKFDLVLFIEPGSQGLDATLEYSRDLFDAPTARRLLTWLETLLAGAAANPERRLSDLPLLSESERRQLVEWNDTAASYPRDRTLPELFGEQVERRPEAVAVVAASLQLTYGELARRAKDLAAHLRHLGVGPEVPVAITLGRSPEMLISILAVLEAGGVYVPLDPAYPEERRNWMLEDSGAALLLDGFNVGEGLAPSRAGASPAPTSISAGSAAYLMYTSGSTGLPKAVTVPHRAVARLVLSNNYARFGPDETWAQLAPASFDASTLEIWGALIHGSRLVLLPPGPLSPHELGEELIRHQVTSLWLTAGLFHRMVEENLDGLQPLRQLLAGGDVLSPDHARRALAALPELVLINGYGPTENTTFTACHPMTAASGVGASVPLGRPIANTRVHLLDAALRRVPIGVAGELCAAGDGLARGYHRRPDLTAERFIPDPEGAEPGARLYRTGDLARRRPDGTLEFLGRIDRQVKIRGFRVEPGEVETVLATHPAVRQSAVLVEERTGDKRLIGYVAAGPERPAAAELRDFLRGRLPEFLVPSAFVVLDALPLTPNGKVDRAALSRIGLGNPERVFETPRGFLEETLAAVFADVLGTGPVGRHDGFFDLGGHSLLATRAVSRLRSLLGVEVPLRLLFETPTVAELAGRIGRETGIPALPPIVPAFEEEKSRPAPLSYAQRRLWFLDRLDPGSPAYNIAAAIHLSGPLDAAALTGALEEIVRRHEALRTTFREEDGEPVQVVSPPGGMALPLIDLSARESSPPGPLSQGERGRKAKEETNSSSPSPGDGEGGRWERGPGGEDSEGRRLIQEEARRPFDLRWGPLFRPLLLRFAEEKYILFVMLHHIVGDGWSAGVMVRELAALYSRSPLPELPVQYTDYARWQRRWLTGEVLEAELVPWRERLQGLPARLDLPTDRPRPAVQRLRGALRPAELSEEVTTALATLARREGATLFMALLAGFQALLGRYTGQDDLAVGTPVAGRDREEIEGLIGFFVNTLVLRGDLAGDPSFTELLARTRETALAAQAHRALPFEVLVEELRPERSLAHAPLFQVMLAFQGVPDESLRMERVDTGTAKLDLLLDLAHRGGRLAGFLEYDTDLFDAATVDRLLAHFEVLLAGAVAEPATRLSELPLLTSEERWQLLAEAGADVEAPWRTLHEGFERQAERTPDRIAVVWGEQRVSYGDLARRSGEMVAGPETIVAVRMPRTPELVVRLLGVLRSGAAYLPIDPSYPEERAEWMIADAGALTPRPPLPTALPATGRGGEGNLAYLIYTSGSTGRPKAVAIEHVSAVRMVAWAGTVYGEEELAGVLASTSVSFDLSIFEIFVPLLHGGTVILIDDALTLHDVPAAVTLINTVPSAMAGLLELGPLPASVKTVNLAGEPLRQALADRVYEAGVERLWNLYGPSEDTTYSTGEIVQKGKEPGIGRPVAGSRAYVLDRALRLQPVGVPGELCLGGGGLARGYLRRPELTAERWVPDPFSGEPGARLYLTGDLGWWREGRLEYLGRLDRQVKVRGFRIEPGEIEAALLAHPAVRDAAVLAREGTLAAFVVPAPDVPFRLEELRRHLQSRLPAPLVPSSFTRLTGLPLTPNGKVDREALARFGKAPERPAFEPPRGHLEETLAAVWADVLNIQRIGRHDDFFHLGGHSLLATRIVSRLRSLLGVELPVRALFETPTLAGLAARIEREDRLPEPPIERIPPGEPAPLSFAQQRLWFLNQLDPTSPVYNLPVAVRFVSPSPGEGGQGGRERGPGGEGLSAILRRHDALRTVFPSTEAGPVQVVTPPAPFHLPLIDLSALNDAETAAHQLIQAEARRPFDLERGPVFRALLVQVRPGDHTLAVTMHHIVSDGWSLGVFVRELAASSPLPELPVQYADYAVWQRRRLTGELLERELAFWREELRGLPPGLDLPADRPRPALRTFRGGRRPFHLDACLANGLRALARREAATPFMVAMAGFQALLSRLTGQDDLAVGTPVAGRTRVDLEDLIGFFVNTLVLRADLSGDPDVRELLGRVRSRALAAQAHQDLPFEKLVEELQPVRDLARTPFFQTLLVFQNTGREPLHIPGLTVETFEVETGTAKFDFALSLEERGEEIAGAAELNLDLFDPATVDRLLGHLRTLLAGMVEEPGRRLSELPLLSEPERRHILIDWNPAGIELPPVRTLAELFEEQAARRPDAPAVVHGDERWSYGDLDRAANRLARRLRRLGVGPEVRVALHLDRSIGQVAAILGVIKAGGVYVPLDPTWPAERIDFVLEDSGAKVTVTPELLEEHEDDSPLPLSTLLENAAYVIYTSGSTGKPKGVAVTHANVARLLSATRHWFGFDEDDVWTMFHSYAFDFSVWEMWGALAHGGRLVVVPYETSRSPEALHRLLTAEKVTVLNQTPSAFRQLGPGEGETSLRSVIFGGEALDPTSLAPWFERYGDERPRLVNMYGITEITVHGTYRPVNRLDAGSPIGVPIPDLRIHLLDWHLQPVPALAPGEICVGGAGLARGYLGRPDLTAERFIPDPFAGLRGEIGARLYRSGDLARYRPDGDVEYLGRIDQQVKIRGFRIEPGEVEAALALHPKVGESAVVAREDRPGDRRLVAYVTPRNGLAPATDELRAFLRERLPDYMVPAAFLPLPALPLTANGKLDRRALPAPEPAARPVSAPPRNATEEAIADAWREVLGVPAIGVDDNFFDLGGHSLLLVQAHRRLRERFPEVAVVDLFRFPTVASLALYLTREQVEQIPLEASRERAESRAGRLRRQRLRRG